MPAAPIPPRRVLGTAPIEFLHPSAMQPRAAFDEDKLDQLAQFIMKQGVLQPILVRVHRTRTNEWRSSSARGALARGAEDA